MTKEQFDKLYSPDVTKREYDEIIEVIDQRVDEIVKVMVPDLRKKGGWYDYDNLDYDDEGHRGHFDINKYKEIVYLNGQINFPEPYFENAFPTRWLWEDFESEFRAEVEKDKTQKATEKERKQHAAQKAEEKRFQMTAQIRAKLSKEELKYIKFK